MNPLPAAKPGLTNVVPKPGVIATNKAATNKESLFPKPRTNVPTNAVGKAVTNYPVKGILLPAK